MAMAMPESYTNSWHTHRHTPFLQRLIQHHHVSNSSPQFFGILTLLITTTISLLLTALTLTIAILSLILFSPFIILSTPIWLPPFLLFFFLTATFLSFCGFGLVTLAFLSWVYRYFRKHRFLGSHRVDSASHGKDFGRGYDYGGYLQGNKVKYAAPGA